MQTRSSTGQTVTQQFQAQQNHQRGLRLDAEVRDAAMKRGTTEEQAGELAARARRVFVVENGQARPVKEDGTPWRRPDGWLITVEGWVAASLPRAEGPRSMSAPPAKNPFKRETWNLTEQMRIQKQDPRMAAQLRDACFV